MSHGKQWHSRGCIHPRPELHPYVTLDTYLLLGTHVHPEFRLPPMHFSALWCTRVQRMYVIPASSTTYAGSISFHSDELYK